MSLTPADPALDALADGAITTVRSLIAESDRLRRHGEQASRKRFSRLFKDPKAIEVTITLTDEVMRINSVSNAANNFRRAVASAPKLRYQPRSPGCNCIGVPSYCHDRNTRTTSFSPSTPG